MSANLVVNYPHLWERMIQHQNPERNPLWGDCTEDYCRWHIKGRYAPAILKAIREAL